MAMKLGLRPVVNDPRTLKLDNYLNLSTLPTPPSDFDWTMAMVDDYSMYANGPAKDNPRQIPEGVGDCFYAMHARRRVLATANANAVITPTVMECLGAYSGGTGFDLNNSENTDYGTEPTAGMKYMQQVGMGTGARNFKIGPWVSVDWRRSDQVAAALWIFGHLFYGIEFPAAYEMATTWGTTNSRIIGGHAILGQAIDKTGAVKIDSWAKDIWFTEPAQQSFCTFLAVSLCDDWISPLGATINGFDREALTSDLAVIQNG